MNAFTRLNMNPPIKLGDIADIQTGPFGSQLHQEDYVANGTPIVTVEHLGRDRMTTQNLPMVSLADVKRLSKYTLAEGDTVFSRVGSVDRASYVHREEDGWMFSGRCLRVRPDSDKVNPRFLSFLLRSPAFTSYIKSIAVGATMPSINTKLLSNAPVSLPARSSQEKIADILDAFESKIEMNRKMNETLEQIGYALFQNHFIGNPKADSWKTVKVGELVSIKGGGTPSTKNSVFWNGDISWTSPRDLTGKNDAYILSTDKKISNEGLKKISSGLLPEGTLLLSSRAPIGYIALTGMPLAINQGYIAFLPDAKLSNYYMFFWLRHNMQRIKNAANGSTFMEISKSSFRNITTLQPDSVSLKMFDTHVHSFFVSMRINQEQTQTLVNIRDSLLPRLIAGKLMV